MQTSNSWAKLSAADAQAFGTDQMDALLERLEALEGRFKSWQMHETSELAYDNAASILHRKMSEEIHYLISSAVDHLSLIRYCYGRQYLPPFALYSSIRSAIDSTGVAHWLSLGGTTDKRLLRLLTLQWAQRGLVNTYTRSVDSHTQEITDWLKAVLTFTKDQRGQLKQRSFTGGMPRITDLLISVEHDLHWSAAGLSPLNAWRACSGVTHGNSNFSAGLMGLQRPVALADGTVGTSRSTTPAALSLMLRPAIEILERLMDRTEERSQETKRPPGKPISGGPQLPLHLRVAQMQAAADLRKTPTYQ